MGLIRFVIIALLAWLLYRAFKARFGNNNSKTPSTPQQTMVKCAQCELHLPQERAVKMDDQWYCSREHGLEHQRESDRSDD